MVNRLEPINLMDWTGGLNLRRNQFQLADNESPDMLNVDVDPRGGFYARKGWLRWNTDDIVDPEVTTWQPRNAAVHNQANGDQIVYVVNDAKIYSAGTDRVFTELPGVVANAEPHDADFAAWGDYMYIATGMFSTPYRRFQAGAPEALFQAFSEVESPVSGTMPQAEFVAGHGGYLFCAVTSEASQNYFARVRWSHPSKPDSWRADDYIDIDSGGGKITGIISFRDHLLIFKTNSMWALYGYDDDSWQLIKVSMSVGCPSITAVTRSETAAYFFSASNKGAVYGYAGETPTYMSENLRPALEDIVAYENVFVSWAGRRLWVGVPWIKGVGSTTDVSSTFVFDPDIGDGAWTMYRSAIGSIAPVIDGSDVNARYPLAALWSGDAAVMVVLDRVTDAYDAILEPAVLGTSDGSYLSTGNAEDIGVTGRDPPGEPFETYYRTRWLHAGWPDRKKSWRRPTFIVRQVPHELDLIVETFRDYNETTVHRSRTLKVETEGNNYWTETGFAEADVGGFDWTPGGEDDPTGTGGDWGPQQEGSSLIRSGSMGLAKAVQMRVRPAPYSMRWWGVDGIVAKIRMRRFR
jgi:hypothetical protein